MAATPETDDGDRDDPRMTLAEIGGALSEEDYQHAERLALELLGDIRRQKSEGDQ